MAYLIGVDLGTSGTKTVLFAEDGTVATSCTIEYPLYQPQNGWAEQDPLDWWNAVCGTTKAVIAKAGISASEIKGVGLSGQMHGLVMLDKSGNVLRKSIIWCDQRTAKECGNHAKSWRGKSHQNYCESCAHWIYGFENNVGKK